MANNLQEMAPILDRWRPDYEIRAALVQSDLVELFQEALINEDSSDLVKHGGVSKSLRYIATHSDRLEHRIVLFIYSAQFDEAVASAILDSDAPYRPGDPTPREIFMRKVARLGQVFEPFILLSDTLAGHYVAALMQGHHGSNLPLIWDVPTPAEGETGFSPHAMWWTSFQYLCEISDAIFAYGGFSQEFYKELTYVLGRPHLRQRLLWLDQDLSMHFADDDTVIWPASDIATVLTEVTGRSAE